MVNKLVSCLQSYEWSRRESFGAVFCGETIWQTESRIPSQVMPIDAYNVLHIYILYKQIQHEDS